MRESNLNLKLAPSIKLVNSWPCLYIEGIDALVIADLHLGFETIKTEQEGVAIPKVQGKQLLEMMQKILRMQKASTIIINGDIKHEFSEGSYHEYKEVSDFLEFLSRNFKKVFLIKGNHDNFLIRATRRFENVELRDDLKIGEFYFAHGHKPLELKKIGAKTKTVIIAHEHPALALYDELHIKEKVKCLLHGKIGGRGGKFVIILPAASIFAPGTDVNTVAREEFLTPLLQKYGVDNLEAVGIVEGEECLKFPKISKLRTYFKLL